MNSDNLKQPVISSMYFTEDSHAVLSTVYMLTRKCLYLWIELFCVHAKAQLANGLLAKE